MEEGEGGSSLFSLFFLDSRNSVSTDKENAWAGTAGQKCDWKI